MPRDPRLKPKAARVSGSRDSTDAWWYEDRTGIDVLVQSHDGTIHGCRIGWAALLRAAQRSSGREIIVRKD